MEAQGRSNTRFGLLSLPDALLTAILLHLDVRTRAVCQLVCQRLAAVGDASPQLWEALSVSPYMADDTAADMRNLDHLLPFLARCTRPIKHLSLSAQRQPSGDRLAPPALMQAACLLHGSLISLSLTLRSQEVEVGQWVQPLRHLTRLSITAEEAHLASSLGTLHCLEKLEIEGAALDVCPACLPRSLSALHLSELPQAPSSMGALTPLSSLRQLALIACQLNSLPAELSGLQSLRQLHASWNVLGAADALSALAALRHSLTGLRLVNCSLTSLPSQLAALSRLKWLGAASNDFSSDGALTMLTGLSTLTRLDIAFCGLEQLPAELSALRSLRMLLLTCSSFTHPDSLVALHGLTAFRYLDLRYCGLRQLPAAFFQLSALEALDLRGNSQLQLPGSGTGGSRSGGGGLQLGSRVLPSLRLPVLSPTQVMQLAPILPSLTRLSRLCLFQERGEVLAAAPTAELCRTLQCMRSLRVLQCGRSFAKALAEHTLSFNAFLSFIRARHGVEVVDIGQDFYPVPLWQELPL